MEGLRNTFWYGDQIVWNNLFRHYIYCLHLTTVLSRFIGDTKEINSDDIPIMSHIGENWDIRERRLFNDIVDRIFSRARLIDFTSILAKSRRKVERNELLLYLRSLHQISLYEIETMHAAYGLFPNKPIPPSPESGFNLTYSSDAEFIG